MIITITFYDEPKELNTDLPYDKFMEMFRAAKYEGRRVESIIVPAGKPDEPSFRVTFI